jgi:hypothetical protein
VIETMDEYTRLYVEARVRLAIGATLGTVAIGLEGLRSPPLGGTNPDTVAARRRA